MNLGVQILPIHVVVVVVLKPESLMNDFGFIVEAALALNVTNIRVSWDEKEGENYSHSEHQTQDRGTSLASTGSPGQCVANLKGNALLLGREHGIRIIHIVDVFVQHALNLALETQVFGRSFDLFELSIVQSV